MISIIAALGKNGELGQNNDLIWHIKKDLQHFKNLTMDKKIVMGLNTYRSLPKKLEGRTYIVLSRSLQEEGIIIYRDFPTLLSYLQSLDEEVMVIGGASIYSLFLPYADNLYLTEIDAEAEADVYFPKFAEEEFEKIILEETEENDINYRFTLRRRKSL